MGNSLLWCVCVNTWVCVSVCVWVCENSWVCLRDCMCSVG